MFQTSFGIEMLHRARRRARRKAAARKRRLRDLEFERTRLDNITKLNAIRSPLLRLPAEIRNLVYHYVFCDQVFELDEEKWLDDPISSPRFNGKNNLGLPRVSRQLNQEIGLLPYKLAIFDFGADVWYRENAARGIMKTFLETRSVAQINILGVLRYEGFNSVKDWFETLEGTGVYWAAELGCKNFRSGL